MVKPKYHIFVCAGGKLTGDKKGLCHTRKSTQLVQKFVEEIDARELSGEVMLSTAGCFGLCDKGPVVAVYPEGVWYAGLDEAAVEKIAESHLEGGVPVQELLLGNL